MYIFLQTSFEVVEIGLPGVFVIHGNKCFHTLISYPKIAKGFDRKK